MTPSGGLHGVTSGIGIRIGALLAGSWMYTTGSSFFSLSKRNVRLLTFACGPSSARSSACCGAPTRISGPQYSLLMPSAGPGSL
jgi:hypothetical protein